MRRGGRLIISAHVLMDALHMPAGSRIIGVDWRPDREVIRLWVEGSAESLPEVKPGEVWRDIDLIVTRYESEFGTPGSYRGVREIWL